MGFHLRDRDSDIVGFSSLLAEVSTGFHNGTIYSYFQIFTIV
jgi:hypothetical protein